MRLRAVAIFGVVTAAVLWPLLRHFGSVFPHDAGDSILNTWILWWGAQATPLTHAWWNGPMFYPTADSLALSELLLSLLPFSLIVQAATHNPVAAFNATFALSFILSGLAAYLLALELTGRDDAAIVGGLAFLLAPYRAVQLSHVQVLSYYWAPLVLLGLHKYAKERHWKWLALFGGAWLAQALANGYALFQLSVLVLLWIVWFLRPGRAAATTLTAWMLAALPMVPILLKYESVHNSLHLLRDINEVKGFGIDIADFLAAPPDLVLWGGRLGSVRPETAAFPGVTLLVLALVALALEWRARAGRREPQASWQRVCVLLALLAALAAASVYVIGPWALGPLKVGDFRKPFSIAVALRLAAFLGAPWTRRMWRSRSLAGFYLLAMAAMYVLALGPEPRLLGRPILYEPPYAWLMHLPGFAVMRVPARFVMLAGLCQSVLVALAVARWATGTRRVATVAAVSAGLLADGCFQLPVAAAPTGGIHAWGNVVAVVEMPFGDVNDDFAALYRSMTHRVPLVNGVSGYVPPHILPLAQALRDRQYSALYELTSNGPIGVALDRTRPDSADVEQTFATMGFTPGPSDGDWHGFIVPARPRRVVALGEQLPIASATASLRRENVGRMLDRDLLTAWGTEMPQIGDEEVRIDLGTHRSIGAIVLEMGAYSFGFPRALEIDVSPDAQTWVSVWGGEVGVLAVHGAVQDPGAAPIVIDLGRVDGRHVRLRQTGSAPGIPWWIAELRVHAPPATAQ